MLRTAAWAAAGTVVVAATIVGAAALLRAVREVYHPWFAHPARFWLLLVLAAITAARLVTSVARRLPLSWRGARHPAATWVVVLPVWMALAGTMHWLAPAASYLWTLPLAAAGLLTLVGASATGAGAMAAAAAVLAVSATLWVPEMREMLRLAVPLLGRMPLVTPVAALPAALLGCLVMLVPPLPSSSRRERPPRPRGDSRRAPGRWRPRPSSPSPYGVRVGYTAEAYTRERPLWRYARAVPDYASGRRSGKWPATSPASTCTWGSGRRPVGTPSRGRSLPGAPVAACHSRSRSARRRSPARLRSPSRVHRPRGQRGRAGARVTSPAGGSDRGVRAAAGARAGARVAAGAAAGRPVDGDLPGAVPPGTIVFTATLGAAEAGRLDGVRVGATPPGPGGTGWQGQPAWLGTERTVWTVEGTPPRVPLAGDAPVPPLR